MGKFRLISSSFLPGYFSETWEVWVWRLFRWAVEVSFAFVSFFILCGSLGGRLSRLRKQIIHYKKAWKLRCSDRLHVRKKNKNSTCKLKLFQRGHVGIFCTNTLLTLIVHRGFWLVQVIQNQDLCKENCSSYLHLDLGKLSIWTESRRVDLEHPEVQCSIE